MQIMEWQRDISDNDEFIDLIKQDFNLFSETIYCFSPKGDAKALPKDATAIDFAYSIHSEIGNCAVKCVINGRECPIETILNNGDMVEIVMDKKQSGPNPEWLDIVKTGTAKSKIRKWFHEREEER